MLSNFFPFESLGVITLFEKVCDDLGDDLPLFVPATR